MARWPAQSYLDQGDLSAIRIGPLGYYLTWHLAFNENIGWKSHYDYFMKSLTNSLDVRLKKVS